MYTEAELGLAKELQAHNYRSNPWLKIYNARHMKIGTSEYQTNRNKFHRLYQSLKNVCIPQMDITTAAYLKWEAENVRISNIKEGANDCTIDFALFASSVKGITNAATTAWKLFFSRKITETTVRNAPKVEIVLKQRPNMPTKDFMKKGKFLQKEAKKGNLVVTKDAQRNTKLANKMRREAAPDRIKSRFGS